MTNISASIKGMPKLRRDIKRFGAEVVPERMKAWLALWGLKMSNDMKRRLSRGGKGRYTGTLANSMGFKVYDEGANIVMKVGSNARGDGPVSYAGYVEGWPTIPRRHYLPFYGHDEFADWARRVAGLRASQIDMTRGGGSRRAGGRRATTKTRRTTARVIHWRDQKKIRGMMVGGPKSIRPSILPAVRANVPLMAKDVRNILKGTAK